MSEFDLYCEGILGKMRYEEVLRHFTPQNLLDAREWIKDCQWQDMDESDVDDLTDLEVVRGICKHYDGGWREFLNT